MALVLLLAEQVAAGRVDGRRAADVEDRGHAGAEVRANDELDQRKAKAQPPTGGAMKAATAVEKLAMDFRRWGKVATLRVKEGVGRYGVVFNTFVTADGKKG